MRNTGLDPKALGEHLELVRELGLEPRIRRAADRSPQRVAGELVVGSLLGFGIFGVLILGAHLLERLAR